MMEKGTVAFSQTIRPLALASTVGLTLQVGPYLLRAGRAFPFLVLWIAPFVYGAAIVFVLPIFAAWPASRQPSYPLAALWGALAALAAAGVVAPALTELARPVVLIGFGSDGAASGLAYVLLLRRGSRSSPSN